MSSLPAVNQSDRRVVRTENYDFCNVSAQEAIDGAQMVGFFGPIGSGKSISACHIAIRYQACYLMLGSEWKKRYFAERLLFALGLDQHIRQRNSVAALIDIAGEELSNSRRLLIIDEFDHAIKNKLVDMVRDLWETSSAPIMIIGEPGLAQNLSKDWKQFSSRVAWKPVKPTTLADTRLLCNLHCPDIKIHDDLLLHVLKKAKGSARSVVANLKRIRQIGAGMSVEEINLRTWGANELVENDGHKRWNGTRWEDVQ
ncbi:ATP-binding protein [Burkholderia sp. RS02]|uniref:ATP-binding protein n=1 Tax=unclassified Burkholderia TaxID=2613784 RepID=UPI0032184527